MPLKKLVYTTINLKAHTLQIFPNQLPIYAYLSIYTRYSNNFVVFGEGARVLAINVSLSNRFSISTHSIRVKVIKNRYHLNLVGILQEKNIILVDS